MDEYADYVCSTTGFDFYVGETFYVLQLYGAVGDKKESTNTCNRV